MILGRQSAENTQYGKQDFTVEPLPDVSLADQLHEVIKHIGGQYKEAELPDLGENEAIDKTLPADPTVKNYSYTIVDGEVYYRENSIMIQPNLNVTAKERVKGMVELRDCVHDLIDKQLYGEVGGQAVLGRQIGNSTPWLTERHGYDPTYRERACERHGGTAGLCT